MQIYPGADLIECEIVGRPLHLPLLREGDSAILIDCGTRSHARKEIPAALEELGVENLAWLIVTHPDGDHCGGTAEIKKRYPKVQIACGSADATLVESPDYLFEFRYDAYRRDHGVFFDPDTARAIRNCSSEPQPVTLTFTSGEAIHLQNDRVLEIWHLPGHSHGHLGVYDRKHRALFYGDAIQGAGYKSLKGGWALCPTYLYVDAYLQTIRIIENSPAQTIVGCHWPVLHGEEAIRAFCGESRNFVAQAERLIIDHLGTRSGCVTLRELCEELSDRLGEWPHDVHLELANAFSGHLDRGVAEGRFALDSSERPFRYQLG